MTATLAELHAERDRLVVELTDLHHRIHACRFTRPPDPACPACGGTGMVGRSHGLDVCTCTRRDPRGGRFGRTKVRGDLR